MGVKTKKGSMGDPKAEELREQNHSEENVDSESITELETEGSELIVRPRRWVQVSGSDVEGNSRSEESGSEGEGRSESVRREISCGF